MTTNPKWFTTALDDRWSWDQSQRLGKPAALFCISKHPDRAEVFYDGNTARIVSQQYCQSDGHYKCKIVSSDGMGGCDPDAQEWEKEEVPETELMPNERQATPPTATPSISNSASAPSSKRKRGSDSSDDSINGSSDDSSEDEDDDDDDDEEEEEGIPEAGMGMLSRPTAKASYAPTLVPPRAPVSPPPHCMRSAISRTFFFGLARPLVSSRGASPPRPSLMPLIVPKGSTPKPSAGGTLSRRGGRCAGGSHVACV